MTLFFTSDTHFGHRQILEGLPRPFPSVEAMDEAMIRRWNRRVRPQDTVFHLGDVIWHRNPEEILNRLNGKKVLVRGNHDSNKICRWSGWQAVHEMGTIVTDFVDGQKHRVTLCHFAMRCWDGSHHGSLHLYGHTHGTFDDWRHACDVGVDRWDYTPITLADAKARMATAPDLREGYVSERSRPPVPADEATR